MHIFFDTEFTGLHKDTSLISIGMISDEGDTFYAEITDYDKTQINSWLQENVIDNLILTDPNEPDLKYSMHSQVNKEWFIRDTKEKVAEYLKVFLKQFTYIELVSDVSHYDMVLLIDLFGTAFDMPDNISPVCYDINQDIAKYHLCTNAVAFDISREELLDNNNIVIDGDKHNALYDAKVIKAIYYITRN